MINPDIAALAAACASELVFAQVIIRRINAGFELHHSADRFRQVDELRVIAEPEVRRLAQYSPTGAFRPLKSAPNLPAGWRIFAKDERTLGAILNQLYPGAVADWFAAQTSPPVVSYRQFTARQTGMYRITTMLDDPTAAAMMRACCHADFCLKRRLWTVGDAACDEVAEKSAIPCLEPCAILLEFARKVARWEQQGMETKSVDAGEISASPAVECDFDAANNPRRQRYEAERKRLGLPKNQPP